MDGEEGMREGRGGDPVDKKEHNIGKKRDRGMGERQTESEER